MHIVLCKLWVLILKIFIIFRNQKKHLENVRILKESMMEEDLLNSDDLKDTDDEEIDQNEIVSSEMKQDENLDNNHAPNEIEVDQPKVSMKGKNKKNKNKGKKGKFSQMSNTKTTNELQCAVCQNEFQSKNKLFAHLKESGHSVALKS